MTDKNAQPKDELAGLADKNEIRRRARQNIQDGAVTGGYVADRARVIGLLNEALATEIICVLRYKRHYYTARGINSQSVAEEFLEHAAEEQEHADRLAERISQLGGEPDLNPRTLEARAHSEYFEGKTLQEMMREDLVNERIAIDAYSRMIRFVGEGDPTTRRMLEEILAKEEEHANDLTDLLARLEPSAEKKAA